MKFGQEERANLLARGVKFAGALAVISLTSYLFYRLATAEQKGREQALEYEQREGKKKKYL